MWKTSKLSQVGGKAFKFVNVKLQINKLDADDETRCVCWSNMDECARKSTSRNFLTKASKGVGLRGEGGV